MDEKIMVVAGGLGTAAIASFFQQYSLMAVCAFWGGLVALTLQKSLAPNMRQLRAAALVFVRTSLGIVFSGVAVYFERTFVPHASPGLLLAASAFGIAAYGPEILLRYVSSKTK